jgi:hypothetical protein
MFQLIGVMLYVSLRRRSRRELFRLSGECRTREQHVRVTT